MFFLTNADAHFQLHFVTIIEYGQNVNKHHISWFWGKMGGVYVTYVASVDIHLRDQSLFKYRPQFRPHELFVCKDAKC